MHQIGSPQSNKCFFIKVRGWVEKKSEMKNADHIKRKFQFCESFMLVTSSSVHVQLSQTRET